MGSKFLLYILLGASVLIVHAQEVQDLPIKANLADEPSPLTVVSVQGQTSTPEPAKSEPEEPTIQEPVQFQKEQPVDIVIKTPILVLEPQTIVAQAEEAQEGPKETKLDIAVVESPEVTAIPEIVSQDIAKEDVDIAREHRDPELEQLWYEVNRPLLLPSLDFFKLPIVEPEAKLEPELEFESESEPEIVIEIEPELESESAKSVVQEPLLANEELQEEPEDVQQEEELVQVSVCEQQVPPLAIQHTPLEKKLLSAAMSGRSSAVKYSLKNPRVNVNIPDDQGRTALMLGVLYEHPGVVKVILNNNPDLDIVSNKGETALSIARAKGNKKFEKLLLRAGAKD